MKVSRVSVVKRTRREVERDLRSARKDAERQAKDVAARVDQASALAGNVVQTGVTAAEKAIATAQDRAATVA